MRHGSLTNLLMPNASQTPEVGSGATISYWTDRRAATVIEATDRVVKVQEDKATRTDKNGMSDSQSYTYEPNPRGAVHTFTKRKNGRFYEKGSAMGEGAKLSLGFRDEHYDYGF